MEKTLTTRPLSPREVILLSGVTLGLFQLLPIVPSPAMQMALLNLKLLSVSGAVANDPRSTSTGAPTERN